MKAMQGMNTGAIELITHKTYIPLYRNSFIPLHTFIATVDYP
jgi:hypothetical protein